MQKENPTFFVLDTNEKAALGIARVFNDEDHRRFPLEVYMVEKGIDLSIDASLSAYVYAHSSPVAILGPRNAPLLSKGEFGSFSAIPGDTIKIKVLNEGVAMVILVHHNKGEYPKTNFKAWNQIILGIEHRGRLKYIDGCTDSIIIPPVKLGDPCLNHLHFPVNIDQTAHTHPSHRIGMVVKGRGECVTPFGNLELKPGMLFIIKEGTGQLSLGQDGELYPDGTHSFRTTDSTLDVIAFHPDSDFGATDVDHPMINRTIVDGVSANKLDDIRTK